MTDDLDRDGRGAPVVRAVTRDVAVQVAGGRFEERDDPRGAERELGAFAFRWVLAILQKMGALRQPGEVCELDQLKRRLGIAPRHGRHFEALIRRLEGEGLVTVGASGIETTERVRGYALTAIDEQVAAFRESFESRHPACAGLWRFMACCLSRYEEIATGRIDAADVVFQDGGMDLFAAVFGGDAVSDYFNGVVAAAVRSAIVRGRERQGGKVRIVEIGAGTGGTTAAILAAIQPFSEAVDVFFTDISQSFIRHARRRFSARYPWLEYRSLNIEEDLSRQGFESHSFDVAVAANVLHDTRDIERTLEQTKRLLKPGGLLVLNEYTAVKDCLFFSGALLHGYWLFEDPERRLPDSCLLGVPQWNEAFERTGFAVAGSFALPTQSLGAECGQSVMLCAASPEAGGRAANGWEKSEIIGRYVEQDILTLLGEERSSAYSARRPLMEMGLDSIELVELKSLVRQRFGVKLSPAFLFEHETQEKMARALAAAVSEEQLRALSPREPGAAEEGRGRPAAEEGAVAIVGIACRFPGGATSPAAFWSLLEGGGHGIVALPAGRWRWPAFVDVEGAHKGIDHGGFLERIDEFDARFFRMSPKEAELLDPQQRLLLELSWEAMEDGGCRPSELSGRKIGVFVGACQSDYRDVVVAATDAPEGYVGSGTSSAMLANRLSYFYDLKGPSLTVDTACSSSLFALHDAVAALRRGACEQALVGAVNLLCSPTISIAYYQAGMLSPTARCRTFDESADGYVRGEGGAMLLLKPLSKAIEHGDSIYGLVKGTAVNHGGQATTLTAPKPDAQAEVVEAAWLDAGLAPGSAGYVEAHGTGTRLGDPVEVSGLVEAFRRLDGAAQAEPRYGHCGLGSVKSNVGHLEGAAGLAGLIKVLLSIQHAKIPQSLNFQRLNPEIDLHGSPFHIVERNEDWPCLRDEQGRELPRRAGVSSFGFGGANAHAVIEEHRGPSTDAAAAGGRRLLPLSAKTLEGLVERAKQLLDFLQRHGGTQRPVDRIVDDLRGLLRHRFGLDEAGAADLEWTELGWGAVETRLFLAAVEEAHGVRLRSRSLVEHPSLQALAEHLAGAGARGSGAGASLEEVAYTLQAGREPMEERAVFLAASVPELAAALRAFLAGDAETSSCYRGYARSGGGEDREVEAALASGDLPALASLWVHGAAIDWNRLDPGARPRRAHLPTYPFARERHWVPAPRALRPPAPERTAIRLEESRFSTLLSGDELFLADHVIQGRRVLPAVAYLEMVRAAVERVVESRGRIVLRSVAWVRPLAVGRGPVRLSLRLTAEGHDGLRFEISSRADGEEAEVFHGQGRAGIGAAGAAPEVDVAAARARCTAARYPAEDCYRALAAMGCDYGPSQRGIDALYVGADEILARLLQPPSAAAVRDGFVLHPAMADAAVQATIGFSLAGRGGAAARPALPFELRSVEIFQACTPAMWALIRRGDASGPEAGTYDIDLCDEKGRLSARFQGLTLRTAVGEPAGEPLLGEVLLTPVWDPLPRENGDGRRPAGPPPGPTAVVGGTELHRAEVRKRCPEARLLPLEPGDGSEEMRGKIAAWGAMRHIVWIVPHHRPDHRLGSIGDDSLIAAQREGVLFCFRLIKALLGEGYGDKPLTWSVITTETQAVHPGGRASPAHAGVHGLLGSLAKEYAHWTIRLLDVPADDWPWDDLFTLAADPHGNAAAWRDGRWHRQALVPYRPAAAVRTAYRPEGVYVVLGGAGGIGEAWSEALLRRGPARIVWIGRRPEDAAIRAKLARLAALGPAPLYIAADATDREQLANACAAIRRRLGRIDGVIHAAIVLQDKSLANMTEDDFRAGLAPKVDVCVRLAQVFAQEPPDFVLFFSSMLAFLKWPGQSNYVAGCAFKDAFAQRLAEEWPCRVRVINWGYWGGVGAAASERHQALMARKGFGSIELPGAMQALDHLLAAPARQLVYLKTIDPSAFAGAGVRAEEWATHLEEAPPVRIDRAVDGVEPWRPAPAWSRVNEEIEESLAELLDAQVRSMRRKAGAPDRYARWWERSLAELAARGRLERPGPNVEAAWESWERRKRGWLRDAAWQAHVELAEAALRALPDVLTGRCAATDVLFADLAGDSSHSLIAKVYREDPVGRFCNETLAAAVAGYVAERRRRDPLCRLRILEIGAGTGATSEAVLAVLAVLAALAPDEGCVEEYLYTDLSKAFLAIAGKALPVRPAYLRFATFDVETPPAEQAIALGSYDLVIATNVLHATKDIRSTLRNAKAVLRANGLLLVNEIAVNSLFHHLTFGLLDGWWLFADSELRIPGGPALRPETWRRVLEQEGFRSPRFLAEAAHGFGQQVLVAESDGFVRQRLSLRASPRPAEQAGARAPEIDRTAAGIAEIMEQPRDAATRHLLALLRLMVAETLCVDPATLDSRSRPFAESLLGEFGMDSLSSNSLRNALRREHGVDIPVHRIISERVHRLVGTLYERLLLRHVVSTPGQEDAEATETFVF